MSVEQYECTYSLRVSGREPDGRRGRWTWSDKRRLLRLNRVHHCEQVGMEDPPEIAVKAIALRSTTAPCLRPHDSTELAQSSGQSVENRIVSKQVDGNWASATENNNGVRALPAHVVREVGSVSRPCVVGLGTLVHRD